MVKLQTHGTKMPRGRARSEPRRQRCGAEAVRRGGGGAKFGVFFGKVGDLGMDQYLLIPFLGE